MGILISFIFVAFFYVEMYNVEDKVKNYRHWRILIWKTGNSTILLLYLHVIRRSILKNACNLLITFKTSVLRFI